MKPPPFKYLVPGELQEAVGYLAEFGDEAKVIAGGQSLVPLLSFRLATPTVLIDLNRLADLQYIKSSGNTLEIGALTRQRSVELAEELTPAWRALSDGVRMIGHVAIRNRGTVGGSLAHADPAAEWPALLVALQGEVEAVGARGTRIIDSEDFFITHFTTSLLPDEIVTRVRVRLPSADRVGSSLVEEARRAGDFALAGTAAILTLINDGVVDDVRVVLIGVHETPLRAKSAEEILRGTNPTDELLRDASESIRTSISPPDDIHASSDFRAHLATVLTNRALTIARDQALVGVQA